MRRRRAAQQKAHREERVTSSTPTPQSAIPRPGGPPAGRRSRITIVNAFWQGDKVVLIDRVDGVVSKRVVPAEYTCFVRAADLDEASERNARQSRHVYSMRREGDWWRIRFRNWKVMRKLCDRGGPFDKAGIEVFEADIRPVRRFLTDNDVEIRKPRRCYIDLEVDPRMPVVRQIEGEARVLTWALVDDEGNKVYGLLEDDTDAAEALLLGDLWNELLEYDQVCAWGLDRYDYPVLTNRTRKMGVTVEPRRWLWLDHLEAFRRLNQSASGSGDEKESMALDRVAQGVLGRGKHDFDVRKNWEVWQRDPMRLVDYNVQDAVLMRDIEAETHHLDTHYEACRVCSTLSDSRGTNPTNFVEGFLLKLGLERGQHFRTMYGINQDDRGAYDGAYVMEPTKTGLLKDVHVCDFASMYPSIIVSWNMSPETLTDIVVGGGMKDQPSYMPRGQAGLDELPPDHCIAPLTDKVFRTDVEGLLPIAVTQLMDLRNAWKRKKNELPPGTPEWLEANRATSGYKIIINAFYGVVGSLFSRFYERDVAESTTQGGKWLILETIKEAAKRGLDGIYSDTDSIFVVGGSDDEFQEFVDWCNADLYPKLLESKRTAKCTIKLGYEKKFSRLVMIRKKRYAARWAHAERVPAKANSKPEVKGLEYKRGDSLRLAREMQYETIKMLLYDGVEDLEAYREFLFKWRTRILEGPLALEDVRMSNSLGKDPRHYHRKTKKNGDPSALAPHVEVALVLRERGEDVGEDVRIEYVVADGRSPIKAIPAEEYDGSNVDRYYMWENLVYPATQRVLEAVFRGHKWRNYLRVRPTRGRLPWGADNLGQTSLF